jgi:hypothetical protein
MKVKVNELYGMDKVFGVKLNETYDVIKSEGYWHYVKTNNGSQCLYKGQVDIVEE